MRDIDVRKALRDKTLKKFYDDSHSMVVEEFGICLGLSRIDVAVVNGSMHGYEIKSDQDTLLRLPQQIEYYNKVFDYLTIVVGSKYIDKAIECVPNHWGVLEASISKKEKTVKLKTVRKAKKNIDIDGFSIAQLLWKEEAVSVLHEVLKANGINKTYTNKTKHIIWTALTEYYTPSELSNIVREKLKLRVKWRAE